MSSLETQNDVGALVTALSGERVGCLIPIVRLFNQNYSDRL